MMPIPPEVLARFDAVLTEKSVPEQLHGYYKKWLRYSLDFCEKYDHPVARKESLPQTILRKLTTRLDPVKDLHQSDLERGYAGPFMVGLLEKKYVARLLRGQKRRSEETEGSPFGRGGLRCFTGMQYA